MAQKVVTVRKMKSLQETTSLGQINCDSDSKANNKWQALINTDRRRFKIQTGDMGPPSQGVINGIWLYYYSFIKFLQFWSTPVV